MNTDCSNAFGEPFDPGRREALGRLGLLAAGTFLGSPLLRAMSAEERAASFPHPHIFWREKRVGNLRTVAEVRGAVGREGPVRQIWGAIERACAAEAGTAPLTCRSRIPGRAAVMAEQNNPDYRICRAAGDRILRHAAALHLTGNEMHKNAALEQLEALFDEAVWPDWIDQSHLRFEVPADLRTGMLSHDTALAYDWLYPFLNGKERAFILEGIGRRGIRPYLVSMEADPWWAHDLNNWYTVIIGGLGIAGMALGHDHPEAERLVEMSVERMRRYLSIYGREGSFNESVAYANATRIPVAYFFARYHHLAGGANPLARHPFPETAEWALYATLPPGRFAAFGDGHAEAPVRVGYAAAIASATGNGVIQDFARRNLEEEANPLSLLWFDPDLEAASPAGKLPLGKAFKDNSALIFSRSSWDPVSPAMIVYGKAKQAQNHGHNDLGQLCIDVRGRRMIIDPGSPSSYPADFFEENRYRYYNASVRGHNVLMFGGREQRYPAHDRGVKGLLDLEPMNGQFLQTHFNDQVGAFWQLDLTRAYDGAKAVRRTVVHLLPGWVAVLDEATLEAPEAISLRWHTIEPAAPDASGNFHVTEGENRLACRVVSLAGDPKSIRLERHAYEAPYHLERMGIPLEQRHEPYVEMTLKDPRCRILSLFALNQSGATKSVNWERAGERWKWAAGEASGEVVCRKTALTVRDEATGKELEVKL